MKNTNTNQSKRFVIGYIGTKCYWTNWPSWEEPRNEEMLEYNDSILESMAYTKDGSVRTEKYQRPIGKEAEAQGGQSGETYFAPCRASCILQYRRALRNYEDENSPMKAVDTLKEREFWQSFMRGYFEVSKNYSNPKIMALIQKYSFVPQEFGLPEDSWSI